LLRAGPVGLVTAIVGSFICGWMFLLSLTFSMQNGAADGVLGTAAVSSAAGIAGQCVSHMPAWQ
jgi:hypothetical protein